MVTLHDLGALDTQLPLAVSFKGTVRLNISNLKIKAVMLVWVKVYEIRNTSKLS